MNDGYRSILKDDESLARFMRAMADFDTAFCKAMNDAADFTLRLELRGDKGRLLHVRVNSDNISRPKEQKKLANLRQRDLSARVRVAG